MDGNHELIDQPDGKPTRKVSAATLGSAIAAVVVGAAVWWGAPQPPAGLEAGFGTLLAFVLGYYVRDRPNT